jgi:F-type H+-transporting ATPase subunit delta
MRYARSLFDLCDSYKVIALVSKDLDCLEVALENSSDMSRLVGSPVFSVYDQSNALGAIASSLKFSELVSNLLSVMSQNRRLSILGDMITAFKQMDADSRGEVSVVVVSADALTVAQEKELQDSLTNFAIKTVNLKVTVDPSLLGGLIVKIGSRQIDTSLRTQLNSLKLSLKEVG